MDEKILFYLKFLKEYMVLKNNIMNLNILKFFNKIYLFYFMIYIIIFMDEINMKVKLGSEVFEDNS